MCFSSGAHPHGMMINPNNQLFMDQNIPGHSNKMVFLYIYIYIFYYIIHFFLYTYLEKFIIKSDDP